MFILALIPRGSLRSALGFHIVPKGLQVGSLRSHDRNGRADGRIIEIRA